MLTRLFPRADCNAYGFGKLMHQLDLIEFSSTVANLQGTREFQLYY